MVTSHISLHYRLASGAYAADNAFEISHIPAWPSLACENPRGRNLRKGRIAAYPENTKCSSNVGLMLGHCLRRWSNIKPFVHAKAMS